mgnify:CR=1 FL=1
MTPDKRSHMITLADLRNAGGTGHPVHPKAAHGPTVPPDMRVFRIGLQPKKRPGLGFLFHRPFQRSGLQPGDHPRKQRRLSSLCSGIAAKGRSAPNRFGRILPHPTSVGLLIDLPVFWRSVGVSTVFNDESAVKRK